MADHETSGTPEQNGKPTRNQRRVLVGVVTRDKTDQTRRVEIQRLVKHKRYGKYIKRRTICYAHDEQNLSHIGDTVEIMEARPLSKTKRWRLVKVLIEAPRGHTTGKPAKASPQPSPASPEMPPNESESGTETASE